MVSVDKQHDSGWQIQLEEGQLAIGWLMKATHWHIMRHIAKELPIFRSRLVDSRGGGSKRTYGSPKSQNSPTQAVECSDQQQPCAIEQSDSSWSSALGATMALIGPLLVLLTFIIMIKFCLRNSYPKGQFSEQPQQQGEANEQLAGLTNLPRIYQVDDSTNNCNSSQSGCKNGSNKNNNNDSDFDDKQQAPMQAEHNDCSGCIAITITSAA